MANTLDWTDIALRLAATFVAGGLIGWEREGHGRPAGLRTTILVCLAASLAMIQANLLVMWAGKPGDSFVTLDLMRLPLGILSGMGFIGGGVILKRENLVLGVTTAATLWFVTVLGLCFGGGQYGLGAAGLVLGIVVLRGLKLLEDRMPQEHRATLVLVARADGPAEEDVHRHAAAAGLRIVSAGVTFDNTEGARELSCEVRWRARGDHDAQTAFAAELARLPGVLRLTWTPQEAPAAGGP